MLSTFFSFSRKHTHTHAGREWDDMGARRERENENEKVYRTGTNGTYKPIITLWIYIYFFCVAYVFKIVFDHHECNEQWKWCFKARFFFNHAKVIPSIYPYTYNILGKREEKMDFFFCCKLKSKYVCYYIVNI